MVKLCLLFCLSVGILAIAVYILIDLFHIVSAHECIGHVSLYFSIIG